MKNHHVKKLYYKIAPAENISYKSPSRIDYNTNDYSLILENDVLIIDMKKHCSSAGTAIDTVRPLLRSWEIQSSLKLAHNSIRFEYDRAEIIDLEPEQSSGYSYIGSGGAKAGGTASSSIEYANYPEPPAKFLATPLVELLFSRFEQFLEGREPLPSMGYFCLSVIQDDAHGREKASIRYKITRNVLDKLGTLVSEIGDPLSARKYDQYSKKRPYSTEESQWIVKAIKVIIKRVAEYSSNPDEVFNEICDDDINRIA